MDFKIEVKCGSCLCKFELRPSNFNSEDAIVCPNCGQPIPSDILQNLRDGVTALGNVPETFPDDLDSFSRSYQFKFAIREFSEIQDIFGKS